MVENPVTAQVASRPAPVQRRGMKRAQAILDAADQILAEEGYAASGRVFGIAFENSRTGDEATIDEARRLMTAYLETYAPKRRR
ncbi:hypothetical protein ABZ318_34340 [Streptomyces sp. NPDC006197]|uniref:hypothetical protein n=1 Tax=Streptomyces sp. NPDC006197 TaxID=3156685 RepID=UPI0033BC52D0